MRISSVEHIASAYVGYDTAGTIIAHRNVSPSDFHIIAVHVHLPHLLRLVVSLFTAHHHRTEADDEVRVIRTHGCALARSSRCHLNSSKQKNLFVHPLFLSCRLLPFSRLFALHRARISKAGNKTFLFEGYQCLDLFVSSLPLAGTERVVVSLYRETRKAEVVDLKRRKRSRHSSHRLPLALTPYSLEDTLVPHPMAGAIARGATPAPTPCVSPLSSHKSESAIKDATHRVEDILLTVAECRTRLIFRHTQLIMTEEEAERAAALCYLMGRASAQSQAAPQPLESPAHERA